MAKFNPTFTERELQNEIWKPIPGYEEWYDVSDLGRIKRVKAGPGAIAGRILSPKVSNRNGYTEVVLHKGEGYGYRVHALVALAFLGPCPEGKEINHKDLIRTNSRLSNLEYVTPSENQQHAIRNGHSNPPRGERAGNAKLTSDDIRTIRQLCDKGIPHREIAKQFPVSSRTIGKIHRRIRWQHIN